MQEQFTTEWRGDFEQRYANTIGWIHLPGKDKVLAQLNEVTDNEVRFTLGGTSKYHINVDSGVLFEFIPVPRAWHQGVDGKIYYTERVPQRQWKRGICSGNTRVINDTLNHQDITFKVLETIINNLGVYNQRPEQGKAVAINSNFAILKNGDLYFWRQKIGVYNAKADEIIMETNLVRQEVTDALKRRNLMIGVV